MTQGKLFSPNTPLIIRRSFYLVLVGLSGERRRPPRRPHGEATYPGQCTDCCCRPSIHQSINHLGNNDMRERGSTECKSLSQRPPFEPSRFSFRGESYQNNNPRGGALFLPPIFESAQCANDGDKSFGVNLDDCADWVRMTRFVQDLSQLCR